jgi:hypothetical protein
MVNMRKNSEPEVRCIKFSPTAWQNQCKELESVLQNKNVTLILSVRDLILQDPIGAKNALQKVSSIVKMNDSYQLAALSREMCIVTSFKLITAGE